MISVVSFVHHYNNEIILQQFQQLYSSYENVVTRHFRKAVTNLLHIPRIYI